MSFRADILHKRLNAVELIIYPPGSVAANIRSLSAQDRSFYAAYTKKAAAWSEARPGEQAYIDLLAHIAGESLDDPVPELPQYIRDKIYPKIQQTDSPEETYKNLLESLK